MKKQTRQEIRRSGIAARDAMDKEERNGPAPLLFVRELQNGMLSVRRRSS